MFGNVTWRDKADLWKVVATHRLRIGDLPGCRRADKKAEECLAMDGWAPGSPGREWGSRGDYP